MIAFAPVAAQAPQLPPPAAVTGPAAAPAVVDDLTRAELLVNRGNDEEARAILLRLEKTPSGDRTRDNEIQFLLGLLDTKAQDYESAVTRFRRVLVSDPKAVRVRLEMGRAYFLMGRYTDAEQQFLYARAGDLPKAVQTNVDGFLNLIRQRKTVSYGLSFAIAPNSNLNGGPSTGSISLYGLPFQLSPDAQAKSGVGLNVDANAEWAPPIGPQTRWRLGAQIHRAQFGQTEFDDMTLALYTGPHVTLNRWVLNLTGNASQRWYGDRAYAASYGPSADATYFLTPRLGVGGNIVVGEIDYNQIKPQNGLGETVGVNFVYTPTPASYVRGVANIGRQGAEIPAYAFDSQLLGLSYVQEFAGGLTAGLSPTFTALNYDAALSAFPVARRDRQYALQLSLLDRRIDIGGLTPRITYTYTKNSSDIELYSFQRNLFEIGFTSSF